MCIETVEDALDLIKDETQRKTKKRAEKAFDEFVQEITEYMAGQKAESATTVYLPISSNNQLLMDVAKAFKHTNINATIEAINKALNHFVSLID